MIAAELVSNVIPALKASDTVAKALERMAEFKLDHMPVIEGDMFVGLLSEEQVVETRDINSSVGKITMNIHNAFVYEESHVYDVIRLFSQLKLSTVPVVSRTMQYKGMISKDSVIEFSATMYSVAEPGGIIVLEIGNKNNSLAYISQIVEAENAQILSSYLRAFPDSTKLEVTLKINRTELNSIIAAFERYNYQVVGSYNTASDHGDSDDRYDSLMNYLNV